MEQHMRYMDTKDIVIIDKENDLLIIAKEGTGDNLLEEDERQGYRDYAMVGVYQIGGTDLNEIDGGQMMAECMIKEIDYDEYVRRIMDFVGVSSNDYEYVRR